MPPPLPFPHKDGPNVIEQIGRLQNLQENLGVTITAEDTVVLRPAAL